MTSGHMQLINVDKTSDKAIDYQVAENLDASLEELVRRARLQAGELSLMIQRLERLRRDIRQHLARTVE